MKQAKTVALIAGFGFFGLAVFTQGVLPALQPQTRYKKVTRVVRTDRGQLKWMTWHATDYTSEQARGRTVYISNGCWYCHSQYVRPVTGETRRWGPVSQVGEYAFDLPHLFGTRRIGPDLTREGMKYSKGWHLAHYWNPRMLYRDSIMPRYKGLFDGPWMAEIRKDGKGRKTIQKTAATKKLFNYDSSKTALLTPNANGLLYIPQSARGKYPIIFTPNKEYTGTKLKLVAASADLNALIAYVQKLGMNRGKWRDLFDPQRLDATDVSIMRSPDRIAHGENVYERRCIGCHGVKGNGNGLAATFLAVRPRNFILGEFKFRHTPSGSLPLNGDLYRTITDGVRGTAMPTWQMLPEKSRLDVLQYIKYDLSIDRSDPKHPVSYFAESQPPAPIYIAQPPKPTDQLLATGKDWYNKARCWECHGKDGRADGPKAGTLKDDWGFPIAPANFVEGLFKSGPGVKDIYRTMSTGLNGTPMPSYGDILSEEQRWAIAYYVLSFSAYRDPVTDKPLPISQTDKAALDDLALKADTSKTAYNSTERHYGRQTDRTQTLTQRQRMGLGDISRPAASGDKSHTEEAGKHGKHQ